MHDHEKKNVCGCHEHNCCEHKQDHDPLLQVLLMVRAEVETSSVL